MSEINKTILITGANGFIGQHLAAHFTDCGYEVRGLVRSPETATANLPKEHLFRGDLPDGVDPSAFKNVDTVIHCAYSTQHRSLEKAKQVNEDGTKLIVRLSRDAHVRRLIFLSSLSAHDQAKSYYGRSKFALEKLFDLNNDIIIRAGFVLGKDKAGLFGRMIEPIKKYPIVPLLDGGRQIIQVIHIDDLCSAIETAHQRNATGVLTLADPKGISLKEFLNLVSSRLSKKTTFAPVPSTPLLYCIKVLERLGIPAPISSENILGLQSLRLVNTTADLNRLGINLLTPLESIDRIFASR